MLINGIKATNYTKSDTSLTMTLICTVDKALSMNTNIIKVMTDQGDLVEQFVGYAKLSATVNALTKEVTLNCFKDENEIMSTVSSAIESNDSQHQEMMLAVAELGSMIAKAPVTKGVNVG